MFLQKLVPMYHTIQCHNPEVHSMNFHHNANIVAYVQVHILPAVSLLHSVADSDHVHLELKTQVLICCHSVPYCPKQPVRSLDTDTVCTPKNCYKIVNIMMERDYENACRKRIVVSSGM